jgi:hypothetical protein
VCERPIDDVMQTLFHREPINETAESRKQGKSSSVDIYWAAKSFTSCVHCTFHNLIMIFNIIRLSRGIFINFHDEHTKGKCGDKDVKGVENDPQ